MQMCTHAVMCVLVGTHVPWQVHGGQRTASGVTLCVTGSLPCSCVIQVIWPVSSGDFPVSTSSLAIGTLGLCMRVAEYDFVWFPGIQTHSDPRVPMASTIPTTPSISPAL